MSEAFNTVLFQKLKVSQIVSTKEIYKLFPNMNKQTVSWHLHKLLTKGDIKQVSHGCYSLSEVTERDDKEHLSFLPQKSRDCYNFLLNYGCRFYFSGLDSLVGKGFNIESTYPQIICVEPGMAKDVQLELMREFDFAIIEDEYDMLENNKLKENVQFYILKSNSFELAKDRFACPEKAFVDLYYAITRMDYPIAVQTLPHVLARIKPNAFKFKLATHDRGLSEELNFLTTYNKAFIKELASIIK